MEGFNWKLLLAQIVNFTILYAILHYFFFRKIGNILNLRKNQIADNIKETEANKIESENLKKEYSGKIDDLKTEAKQIIDKAKKEAEEKQNQIIKESQEKSEQITNRAKEEIDLEKQKAVGEIKEYAADIAIKIAEKLIKEKVDKNVQDKIFSEIGDEE